VYPAGAAAMSFTSTLSADVTGTLSSGVPLTVNLAAVGQAATLTFTTPATQTVVLTMSSVSVTPSAWLATYVYDSSNTLVGSGSTGSSLTTTLANLAAGTYSVVITPNSPVVGSFQVKYQ
jgi:hypothetical protein